MNGLALEKGIELVGDADKDRVVDLFTEAFEKERSFIPAAYSRPGAVRAVIQVLIGSIGYSEGSCIYGIRCSGEVVCGALVRDSRRRLPMIALVNMTFSLLRASGWRLLKELWTIRKERPAPGRYLELILLATLPRYQRRGLGRKMLKFVVNGARRWGFEGVILVAKKDAPAYSLYVKEGFTVDREFVVSGRTLTWMRLEF